MRVGVVGVGSLGRHHVRILKSLPATSWVGIFDIDHRRSEEVADQTGAEICKSVEELASRIDAAVIAAPTSAHAELACALLASGVHVLVEKPIATDLEGANAIVECAAHHRRLVAVGHVEFYNPVVQRFLSDGVSARYVEAQRLGVFSGRGLDVDVVLDLMVHDLHLVVRFAQSRLREIRAVGIPVLSTRMDLVNARLEFESGLVASLTASRVSPEKTRRLRVFTPSAYYSLDLAAQRGRRVRLHRDANRPEIRSEELEVEPLEPLRAELEAFLAACQGEAASIVSGEEGRYALELAIAVRKEAEEGMIRSLGQPVPAS